MKKPTKRELKRKFYERLLEVLPPSGPFRGIVQKTLGEFPELHLAFNKDFSEITLHSLTSFLYGEGACRLCGEPVKPRQKFAGWKTYCGTTCQGKDPELWAQRHATSTQRYGGKVPMQSAELRLKIQATNQALYGEWFVGSTSGRQASDATMLKRHGVINASLVAGAQAKKEATWLAIHGASNPSKSDAVKALKKKTTQRNYGVDNPMQSVVVRERALATNLARYGVNSPMQNPEVWKRLRSSLYARKQLQVGSENFVLQGYEPQAILWLQDHDVPEKYIHQCTESFRYGDRSYHPDFVLRSRKCTIYVEVKSTYTAGIGKHENCKLHASTLRKKSRAIVDSGHQMLTIVMAADEEPLYATLGEATQKSLLSSDPHATLDLVKSLLGIRSR